MQSFGSKGAWILDPLLQKANVLENGVLAELMLRFVVNF